MRYLAGVTVSEFGWLKISEFMLFMRRFMSGRYAHIFGRDVDPLQLAEALREFCEERGTMMARYEQEKREERLKAEQAASPPVTWEEFCERNNIRRENPLGKLFT